MALGFVNVGAKTDLKPSDVGLGNVPNVSTNNQTPTYTEASTIAKLTSGEKLSAAMGKIAKAVSDLIAHLADTTKHITAAERKAWNGKAAGSHTHDDRYYTESEMNTKLSGKSDASHNHSGQSISPASIELFPGASAGNGGYIDFHYNNDSADYTSRLIEIPKGVLKYNDHGLLSTKHIIAVWNAAVTFTNGIAEYSNSAIKANRVCFVQFRAGTVGSTFQDTALSVHNPTNGKLTIVAKNGATFSTHLNILILDM